MILLKYTNGWGGGVTFRTIRTENGMRSQVALFEKEVKETELKYATESLLFFKTIGPNV